MHDMNSNQNEYGIKAPSVATIVTERAARPQVLFTLHACMIQRCVGCLLTISLSATLLYCHLTSRQQGFSKSFQNMKNENTGLNTAITRSTVHKSLDPQFA